MSKIGFQEGKGRFRPGDFNCLCCLLVDVLSMDIVNEANFAPCSAVCVVIVIENLWAFALALVISGE